MNNQQLSILIGMIIILTAIVLFVVIFFAVLGWIYPVEGFGLVPEPDKTCFPMIVEQFVMWSCY